MTQGPVPQRLSDADRDAAVAMLREHFEQGRLDESEFTDRMQKALDARFSGDLMPLFTDLPDPRPASSGPAGWTPGAQVSPWTPPGSPAPTWSTADDGSPDWTPPGAVEPRPTGMPAAPPPWLGTVRTLLWPAAIGLMLVTGSWYWIMVAVVASIILQQVGNQRRPPPPLGR